NLCPTTRLSRELFDAPFARRSWNMPGPGDRWPPGKTEKSFGSPPLRSSLAYPTSQPSNSKMVVGGVVKQFILLCGLLGTLATPARLRASDGDWFILTGDHECASSNPKHPAYLKLQQLGSKDQQNLTCVAFTPHDDWILLFGANGAWTSDAQLPVC